MSPYLLVGNSFVGDFLIKIYDSLLGLLELFFYCFVLFKGMVLVDGLHFAAKLVDAVKIHLEA